MNHDTRGALDDALDRLSGHGAEFDDRLSNHGPMAAEALVRRGHTTEVGAWVDRYRARLGETPAPVETIRAATWEQAWGDPRREADWGRWFSEALQNAPWTEVLGEWWPRLLPGILGGATHGVIRVGHAVRALREDGESAPHLFEFSRALGYWAACGVRIPMQSTSGDLTPVEAIAHLPGLADRRGRIGDRLTRLLAQPGWIEARDRIRTPDDAAEASTFLKAVVTDVVRRYPADAGDDPLMLVHAATAPHAVLQALPSLPPELHGASALAGWRASAAVHGMYAGATHDARPWSVRDPAEAFDRAVEHGDEHAIKLADTVLSVFAWTQDPEILAAIGTVTTAIDPA